MTDFDLYQSDSDKIYFCEKKYDILNKIGNILEKALIIWMRLQKMQSR